MLRVDNVTFTYDTGSTARRSDTGTPAAAAMSGRRGSVLDSITFQVQRGSIVGLLGPNGSGKTTLLRIAGGMLRPQTGQVFIDDQAVTTLSRRALARRIAVVPQETHVTFQFTALDIVLMGRYAHLGPLQLEGVDDVRIAYEAMRATGTETLANRGFDTLSGGEKQRVVIAGAVAQTSDILLLDEPTASLDLRYQIEIATLLTSLNRERGVTMLLATHDLNLAASVCSSLVLLRNGSVFAAGPTEQALTENAVRQLYGVEADVRLHPRTGHLTVVPIGRL